MKTYPTDLTESQWQVIEKIVDPNQRKRKYSLHEIMNALLYITKSGIQWRMLPKDYAPWESVYYYFRKWKSDYSGQSRPVIPEQTRPVYQRAKWFIKILLFFRFFLS